MNTKSVGCRVTPEMYDRINSELISQSEVVLSALKLYFKRKDNNSNVNSVNTGSDVERKMREYQVVFEAIDNLHHLLHAIMENTKK
jgi:hypothetical protein